MSAAHTLLRPLWVASGDDRIGGNSLHSSVAGVAAGMRRSCSLMGQRAARDERMNACRGLRSLGAHMALDGVSWVQSDSVEIAVGQTDRMLQKRRRHLLPRSGVAPLGRSVRPYTVSAERAHGAFTQCGRGGDERTNGTALFVGVLRAAALFAIAASTIGRAADRDWDTVSPSEHFAPPNSRDTCRQACPSRPTERSCSPVSAHFTSKRALVQASVGLF